MCVCVISILYSIWPFFSFKKKRKKKEKNNSHIIRPIAAFAWRLFCCFRLLFFLLNLIYYVFSNTFFVLLRFAFVSSLQRLFLFVSPSHYLNLPLSLSFIFSLCIYSLWCVFFVFFIFFFLPLIHILFIVLLMALFF